MLLRNPVARLLGYAGGLLWRGGREAYCCFRTMEAHHSSCLDCHRCWLGIIVGFVYSACMKD